MNHKMKMHLGSTPKHDKMTIRVSSQIPVAIESDTFMKNMSS